MKRGSWREHYPRNLAELVLSISTMIQGLGKTLSAALGAIGLATIVGACQDNVSTPFPPGLEPLEINPIPSQPSGPYTEELSISSEENPIIKIYARGYVLLPPAIVWAAAKTPDANVAACTTSEQFVTPNSQPEYEFSFAVHYKVHNILTVEWDDQWRFGTIAGTADAPGQAMIKHQKVQGSDFITFSAGTIELSATADPNVTELAFVEHLDAIGGGPEDVRKGVRQNYQALVAVAHGQPIPPCP